MGRFLNAAGFILLVFGFLLLLPSCEEVGPDICLKDCDGDVLLDTTYVTSSIPSPQMKKVLLEDFTGVRCTNCPQGHSLTKTLETQNPDQIIAVALHSDFLAFPYPGNQDLRSQAANDIANIFSPPAKPSALIDRHLFPGEVIKCYLLGKWTGYVNDRLQEDAPVNITLSSTFDDVARETVLRMELVYTEAQSVDNRYGLWIMEDNLQSAQLNGSTIDSPYIHQHVIREYITPASGVALTENLEGGRVIIKEFLVPISGEYDESNVSIGAWVGEGGTSTTILQATKVKIQ